MSQLGIINLSRIDLNLLTSLEALLEERSVTRAASRLFIGQPAMSHHLSRLRELFVDPLLVRHGSQMKLTRRARELAPKVKKILDQVRNDLLSVRDFDLASFDGRRNIGMTDNLWAVYVVIASVAGAAPDQHSAPGSGSNWASGPEVNHVSLSGSCSGF